MSLLPRALNAAAIDEVVEIYAERAIRLKVRGATTERERAPTRAIVLIAARFPSRVAPERGERTQPLIGTTAFSHCGMSVRSVHERRVVLVVDWCVVAVLRATFLTVTRLVSLVLAVAAGLCAAILLAAGPTVQVEGHTLGCPGIIATSEGGIGIPSDIGQRYVRACDDKQQEWAVIAGLAALVSFGAGSVFVLSQRDREPDAVSSHGSHDPATA